MKKTITILTILLFVVFMVGCENSINPIEPTNNQELSLAKQSNPDEAVSALAKGGKDKVEICHYKGNGEYITISVAASAVQAHLNHGDQLKRLSGQWQLWFNGLPIGHLYDFDTGYGGYPSTGEFIRWEKITSNDISCEDGTVSFGWTYIEPTGGYRLGMWWELYGEFDDELNMRGDYEASNGSTGTWIAIKNPS